MSPLGHSIRFAMAYLQHKKHAQIDRFISLAPRFASLYSELCRGNIEPYVTDWWREVSGKLEAIFLPAPPIDFLQNPTLRQEMFMTGNEEALLFQLSVLERCFDTEALQRTLMEDLVGAPELRNARYLTSHNSIHHLFHLARFVSTTRCNLDTIDTVIEWGGGYGNFAKLFTRLVSRPVTYIMIDLPLMTAVQWIYLSSIFGEERVQVLTTGGGTLREGCFNLLPLGLVAAYDLKADLFVSTWALSESSAAAQRLVVDRNWFGARHLLLAFQRSNEKFANATEIGLFAKRVGATLEAVSQNPNDFYAFR